MVGRVEGSVPCCAQRACGVATPPMMEASALGLLPHLRKVSEMGSARRVSRARAMASELWLMVEFGSISSGRHSAVLRAVEIPNGM
jgi:hypothetical protein